MADEPITIELNPSERRLYDRVRAQVAKGHPGAGADFRDVLLLLPDLTVLLLRLLRDERVPLGGKLAALFGVGYVLSPIDLLPALLLGPIGLLDDLFVVSATLSLLLNHVHPDVVRAHWSGSGDVLRAVHRVTFWAESQFSGHLSRLLRSLFRIRVSS